MSSTDIEPTRVYRKRVPEEYRASLDTRLAWLWNQRFGTVQTVWLESPDMLDRTAATMLLQCLMKNPPDLNSIGLVFERLEGGPQDDTTVLEETLRV